MEPVPWNRVAANLIAAEHLKAPSTLDFTVERVDAEIQRCLALGDEELGRILRQNGRWWYKDACWILGEAALGSTYIWPHFGGRHGVSGVVQEVAPKVSAEFCGSRIERAVLLQHTLPLIAYPNIHRGTYGDVGERRGALDLDDGNHRAVSLALHGNTHAPAFIAFPDVLTSFHGTYLRGSETSTVELVQNINSDCKWHTIWNASDNTYSLRSTHGKYLRASSEGRVDQSPHLGSWERFTVTRDSQGFIWKSVHGNHLRALMDLAVDTAAHVAEWEHWN